MVYQLIEPKIWKPENMGDCIEGILTAKYPSPKFPETQQYSILTGNGENFTFYGCTILDARMEHVKISSKVKIIYDGKEQNKKKQDVKMFKVYVDDGKPEVIKV